MLACPSCRKPTVVPGSDADAFPANFILQNIIDELGAGDDASADDVIASKPTCGSCESYGKPGEAVVEIMLFELFPPFSAWV